MKRLEKRSWMGAGRSLRKIERMMLLREGSTRIRLCVLNAFITRWVAGRGRMMNGEIL